MERIEKAKIEVLSESVDNILIKLIIQTNYLVEELENIKKNREAEKAKRQHEEKMHRARHIQIQNILDRLNTLERHYHDVVESQHMNV